MINLERESLQITNKANLKINNKKINFAANNRFATIKNIPEYLVEQVNQKIKEDKELQAFCPEAKNGIPQHIKRELQKYLSNAKTLKKENLASMPEQQAVDTFMTYSLTSYFIIGNELTLLSFNKNIGNVEKQAQSINSSIKAQDKTTFSKLVISVIEAEFKKSGLIANEFSPKAKAEVAQFIATREKELKEVLSTDKKVNEEGRKKLNKITNELYAKLKDKGVIDDQENSSQNKSKHSSSKKSPLKPLYNIGIGLLESLLLLQAAAQPAIAANKESDFISTPEVSAVVDSQQTSEQVIEAMKSGGYVTSEGAATFVAGSPEKFRQLANSKAKATPNITWNDLFTHGSNDDIYFSEPPSSEQFKNLQTMANIMEVIRQSLGDKPVSIVSGYRPTAYNATIPGAAKKSEHTYGNAIDFYVPGMHIQDVEKSIDGLPVSIEYSQRSGKDTIHIDNRLRTKGAISRFVWNPDGSITTVGYYDLKNPSNSSGRPLYLSSFKDINLNYFKDRGLDNITGDFVTPKPDFENIAKAYQANTKINAPQVPKIEQPAPTAKQNLPEAVGTNQTQTTPRLDLNAETAQPTETALNSGASTVDLNQAPKTTRIETTAPTTQAAIPQALDLETGTAQKADTAAPSAQQGIPVPETGNQSLNTQLQGGDNKTQIESLFAQPSGTSPDAATPTKETREVKPSTSPSSTPEIKIGIDNLDVNPSIDELAQTTSPQSLNIKTGTTQNSGNSASRQKIEVGPNLSSAEPATIPQSIEAQLQGADNNAKVETLFAQPSGTSPDAATPTTKTNEVKPSTSPSSTSDIKIGIDNLDVNPSINELAQTPQTTRIDTAAPTAPTAQSTVPQTLDLPTEPPKKANTAAPTTQTAIPQTLDLQTEPPKKANTAAPTAQAISPKEDNKVQTTATTVNLPDRPVSQSEFFEYLAPAAPRLREKGVRPSVALAQFWLETGGKTFAKGEKFEGTHNIAGRIWRPTETRPYKAVPTWEEEHGQKVHTTRRFVVYSSYDECIDAYAKNLLTNPAYDGIGNTNTLEEYLIKLRPYATDSQYINKVRQIIKTNNLERFDQPNAEQVATVKN